MDPIVVSWVGVSDLDAMNAWRLHARLDLVLPGPRLRPPRNPRPEAVGGNGPIRTFTDGLASGEVWLLLSEELAPAAEAVTEWVGRGTGAEVHSVPTGVSNPTDYAEVYEAAVAFFGRHWTRASASRFRYILSPGTPAMHAVMLVLSHLRYPGGKAYRTVDPAHVTEAHPERCVEVRFPFSLAAPVEDEPPLTVDADTMQEVVGIYAPSPSVGILLLGETGVGKTRFAREIHDRCSGGKPFMEVNCAELAAGDGNLLRSELFGHEKGAFTGADRSVTGAFQQARDGTIFLDEIGEMPLSTQAVLLRAIQEKKVRRVGSRKDEDIGDVRVICATNRDLVGEVRAGRFRMDLYYRIAAVPVRLQPLREIVRTDEARFRDIVASLLDDIVERLRTDGSFSIDKDAWGILRGHRWPGNIRELGHVLGLCAVWAGHEGTTVIDAANVERHLAKVRLVAERLAEVQEEPEPDIPENLEAWVDERRNRFIVRALERCGYCKAKASRMLGMTVSQMNHWESKHPELAGKTES